MSIRPKFAYEIFSGKKRYELRRWIGVPVEPGSTVVVYVSGDVRAIMGEFTAGEVLLDSPTNQWRRVTSVPGSGIGRDDWPYIRGAKRAVAIEVVNPRVYRNPVRLETLRSIFPGFNPPLSYRLLAEGDPLLELLIKALREKASFTANRSGSA
ncbi:TPA: DNA-binding protein [Candidatus Micrarchaeota archaeon]|nr:DNA-binding protein [Candidatus Micrarchaeota archaeon]